MYFAYGSKAYCQVGYEISKLILSMKRVFMKESCVPILWIDIFETFKGTLFSEIVPNFCTPHAMTVFKLTRNAVCISKSRNWFLKLTFELDFFRLQAIKIKSELEKNSSSKIKFKNQFCELGISKIKCR